MLLLDRTLFSNAAISTKRHVIAITESFLTSDITDAQLFLPEYNIYRSDRKSENKSNHGGVLLAVRKEFNSVELIFPLFDSWILVQLSVGTFECIMGVFYNPPANSDYRWQHEKFVQIFDFLKTKQRDTLNLVCGDVNFPKANWSTSYSPDSSEQLILNSFDENNFQQLINIPTRSSNILDVNFTRRFENVDISYDEEFERVYNLSHHRAKKFSFCINLFDLKVPIEKYYSYNRADYDNIRNFMAENPFNPRCFTNVDIAKKEWYTYINDIIAKFVPLRTSHRQSLPPWITSTTSHLMKKVTTQKSKLTKNYSKYCASTLKEMEQELTICIENDRCEYFNKLCETRDTQRIFKFFKIFKADSCLPQFLQHDNTIAETAEQKVNLLNSYLQSVFSKAEKFDLSYCASLTNSSPQVLSSFSCSPEKISKILQKLDISQSRGPDSSPPCFFRNLSTSISYSISVLFRIARRTGTFPTSWKIGAVSPLFKSGSRSQAANYRPVTLLNIIAKVLEKCIYDDIYLHCLSQYSNAQHGFMRGRSVFTNLVPFLDRLYKNLDSKCNDLSVFYSDFAKAFDKVPHKLLTAKMEIYRIKGKLLEILCSYLANRKQYVRCDRNLAFLRFTVGFPRVQFLGPYFSVYLQMICRQYSIKQLLIYLPTTWSYSILTRKSCRMI